MKSLLSIKQLSVSFGENNFAVRDINFSLQDGEFVVLLGSSGAGKSSILRIIAGLIKPTEGYVYFSNKLISSNKSIVPTGQRNIALMFQEDVLFPHLTVYKNISFGIEGKTNKEKEKLVLHYLKEFGLLEKKNYFPNSLSGGEKQRVALARVLITKPKALLMDEPFGALDALTRAHLQDALMEIHANLGNTVIMITHDVDEAVLLSDRIVMMNNGPAATIGEILNVELPRPRERLALADNPEYNHYRHEVLTFLYDKQKKIEPVSPHIKANKEKETSESKASNSSDAA